MKVESKLACFICCDLGMKNEFKVMGDLIQSLYVDFR